MAHTALAMTTSRVRCGSLVYCAGYRHPAVLANAMAGDRPPLGRPVRRGPRRRVARRRVPGPRDPVPLRRRAPGHHGGVPAVRPRPAHASRAVHLRGRALHAGRGGAATRARAAPSCRSGSAAAASNARCGSSAELADGWNVPVHLARGLRPQARGAARPLRDAGAGPGGHPLLGERGLRPRPRSRCTASSGPSPTSSGPACWWGPPRRWSTPSAATPTPGPDQINVALAGPVRGGGARVPRRGHRTGRRLWRIPTAGCTGLRRGPVDPQAHRHRAAPARAGRTCPPPAAPSAPADSRPPRPLRRALVPQPVAGHARRPLRDGAVHPGPRRRVLDSSAVDGARKVVDLWAERTAALGSRDDVDYVLVFENRGPGGRAPPSPTPTARSTPTPRCRRSRCGSCSTACSRSRGAGRRPGGVRATATGGSGCRTPRRGPTSCCSRPAVHGALTWSTPAWTATAWPRLLVDVLARLDQLFDAAHALHAVDPPAPAPTASDSPAARLHLHVAPLLRAPGTCHGSWPRRSWAAGCSSTPWSPRRPRRTCGRCQASRHAAGPDDGGDRVGRRERVWTAAVRVEATRGHVRATAGTGQPDRRPHRLHGRPGAAHGHRPGDHRERSAAVHTLELRLGVRRPAPDVGLPVSDPARSSPTWARYPAAVAAELGATVGLGGTVASDRAPSERGCPPAQPWRWRWPWPWAPPAAARRARPGAASGPSTPRSACPAGSWTSCASAPARPATRPSSTATTDGRPRRGASRRHRCGWSTPARPRRLELRLRRAASQREAAAALVGPLPAAGPRRHRGARGPAAAATAGPPRPLRSATGCRPSPQRLAAGDLDAAGRAHGRQPRGRSATTTRCPPPCWTDSWRICRRRPGVHGARLTGAGFGGCVVALTRPGTHLPAGTWIPAGCGVASGPEGVTRGRRVRPSTGTTVTWS